MFEHTTDNPADVVIDVEATSPGKKTEGMSGTEVVKCSTYFRPWHKMIARKTVLRGMKPAQIGREMNMSGSYVSQLIQHHPMMKAEIARLEKMLEEKIIEAEVQDFVKDEFMDMIPQALEIIRESIGDMSLGIAGKSDLKERRADAFAIIDRVSPKAMQGEPAVNIQLQLNQVIADNKGKSANEVITSLTSHIREKKALQRGK